MLLALLVAARLWGVHPLLFWAGGAAFQLEWDAENLRWYSWYVTTWDGLRALIGRVFRGPTAATPARRAAEQSARGARRTPHGLCQRKELSWRASVSAFGGGTSQAAKVRNATVVSRRLCSELPLLAL